MRVARGGWVFILVPGGVLAATGALCEAAEWLVAARLLWVAGALTALSMVYFFRDPERQPLADPGLFAAGADGWIRAVDRMREDKHLHMDTVRICTFLTPFDVHVNRSPMAGTVKSLAYYPGKHMLTIRNASSEHNEHSSIVIEGGGMRCLVKQIVGPVVRRVVYWLHEGQVLGQGERIGIMKFGSRLDVYLPAEKVEVLVKPGDRVFAGLTPIARLRNP
jgi:phosphatidylserine decarboxylase